MRGAAAACRRAAHNAACFVRGGARYRSSQRDVETGWRAAAVAGAPRRARVSEAARMRRHCCGRGQHRFGTAAMSSNGEGQPRMATGKVARLAGGA
eukprot:TRINITY_DN11553_c0_g1_i1.p3 TRINITY_DN11553_c0_g1~~TRINITY_DN11553_c0_g1_i1.p3  ORF type:complete len:106 (-),score=16.44 TRINITY_DN11553_c0_g1_i1:157-444(-)